MARLAAILKALWRVFQRGEKSFASLAGNNFFLVAVLFLGKAGSFLFLIMGLVILFPLSTDPLRKIPASRLALWPLERRERWLLRAVSPWVNPMTWAIAALALWAARGSVTVGLWALAAGLFAAGFALSELPLLAGAAMWRRVPHFPGPLDQLVRKNLREMLSTLDFYCALLLSASVGIYRLLGRGLPAEADLAMTVLVVVALAMGRRPAVEDPRPQTRWRFSAGTSPVYGIVEVMAMASAASAIYLTSALLLAPCVAAWAGSLWWYGRRLETQG